MPRLNRVSTQVRAPYYLLTRPLHSSRAALSSRLARTRSHRWCFCRALVTELWHGGRYLLQTKHSFPRYPSSAWHQRQANVPSYPEPVFSVLILFDLSLEACVLKEHAFVKVFTWLQQSQNVFVGRNFKLLTCSSARSNTPNFKSSFCGHAAFSKTVQTRSIDLDSLGFTFSRLNSCSFEVLTGHDF